MLYYLEHKKKSIRLYITEIISHTSRLAIGDDIALVQLTAGLALCPVREYAHTAQAILDNGYASNIPIDASDLDNNRYIPPSDPSFSWNVSGIIIPEKPKSTFRYYYANDDSIQSEHLRANHIYSRSGRAKEVLIGAIAVTKDFKKAYNAVSKMTTLLPAKFYEVVIKEKDDSLVVTKIKKHEIV